VPPGSNGIRRVPHVGCRCGRGTNNAGAARLTAKVLQPLRTTTCVSGAVERYCSERWHAREGARLQLRDESGGWNLTLQDGAVQLIQIDFRLGLFLSDASGNAQLYIETPCRLKGAEGEVWLTPNESHSLAPVLPLFNAKVAGVAIQKTGQLQVEFGDGRTLLVEPDKSYEAWQLGCSSLGFLLVCAPGGDVCFFPEPERPTNTTSLSASHTKDGV
jgi:hypothetical protein